MLYYIIFLPIIVILAVLLMKEKNKNNINYINNNASYNNETNTNFSNDYIKFCPTCGAEVHPNAVICVKCGCALPTRTNLNDKPSIGLNVISFLLPIVGLILYIVYHEKSPIKAKAIGKWALISFAINVVAFIVSAL